MPKVESKQNMIWLQTKEKKIKYLQAGLDLLGFANGIHGRWGGGVTETKIKIFISGCVATKICE